MRLREQRGAVRIRFSGRVTAAIFLARQRARQLGHAHVEPEHLLLGLLRVGRRYRDVRA